MMYQVFKIQILSYHISLPIAIESETTNGFRKVAILYKKYFKRRQTFKI